MHNEVKEENVSVCARTECEDQKTKKITGSIFPLALEVHTYMYVYIETYIDRCLRLRRTLSRMSSSFEDGQESTFVIACTHNGEPAGYSRWLRQQVFSRRYSRYLFSCFRPFQDPKRDLLRLYHVIAMLLPNHHSYLSSIFLSKFPAAFLSIVSSRLGISG